MPSDIKSKQAASAALTVTSLHSLASSQDWTAGWGSAVISNLVNNHLDMKIGASFSTHASNRQAGSINIYIIGSLNDTPLFPASASGTIGTEGAVSFADTEERDAACRPLGSITVDASGSAVMPFPETAIAALFNGVLPSAVVIFVAQNAGTTTTAGLAAAGSVIYQTGSYGQFT